MELCTLAREETTTDDWSMPSYWLLLWVTKVQLPITFHLIRAPWHHHPLTPTALALDLYLNWYPLLLNWLFSQQFPIPIVCLCNLLIWFEHSFVEQIVRYTCTTGIRHMSEVWISLSLLSASSCSNSFFMCRYLVFWQKCFICVEVVNNILTKIDTPWSNSYSFLKWTCK